MLPLETLRLSRSIVVSSTAIALISTVDVILARHYLTNVESGAYAAVALVGKTLFFAMSFMPTVLLPKAAQSASAADLRKLLLNAGLVMGALSALALAVFFFVPGALIRLLAGQGYENAASYVFSYGIAMAALGAANGFAAYRIGVSDFRYVRFAVILACVEIIGIAVFHGSIGQIVSIVLAVTIGLLVAVLWGIGKARQNVFAGTPLVLLQQEVEAH
jgi:O-antigen/teichoic acid export membrane protein